MEGMDSLVNQEVIRVPSGRLASAPAPAAQAAKEVMAATVATAAAASAATPLGSPSSARPPTLDDATKKAILFGALGAGGKGGNMDVDMNHGPPGNAAACWDFAKNIACGP